MLHSYLRAVKLALLAGCLCPVGMLVAGRLSGEPGAPSVLLLAMLVLGVAIFGLAKRLLDRHQPAIAGLAERQARFLDELPEAKVRPAIILSAAVSLFLELAVIRWHTTLLELFAFYKNFSLLACFAGLGLGYALASSMVIPLLA